MPTFQDISEIDTSNAPAPLDAAAPDVTDPTQPAQLAEFGTSLPSLNLEAQFPSAPSLLVPAPPNVGDREAPPAPNIVLPAFSGIRPEDAVAAPNDLAAALAGAYQEAAPRFVTMADGYVDAQMAKINPRYHEQLTRIEDQLAKYLDGGTGLKPEVEDAIYSRARGKNDAEARRVRDQALNDAATRGFTLPTGALMSAMQQARQAGADTNARAASEIVAMQAEMEQKNLQFAVTTSTGLRTAMVSATLGYLQSVVALNGQASAYAQSMVNALVETYNASVRLYTAKIEGYKADAQVYQTLVQSALVGIEVYKAEIQALQALTQVDMSRVAVYRARIDVLTSLTTMYKTQVDATVSKASLERLKVDLFQAQVQAYGAQVTAKTAEWQGFTAQVGGNVAKLKMRESEIGAYSAQVAGYKASIDAQSAATQAQAMTNDARAKQYIASVEAYKAVVMSKGEVARTQLENQRQSVVAFQAQTAAAVADAQVRTEFYKATSDISIKQAQLGIDAALKSSDLTQQYGRTIASLHQSTATVHANLAGAAMAGMNALAVEYAAT